MWSTMLYVLGVFGAVMALGMYPGYRLVKRGKETTAANIRSGYVVVSGTVASCGQPLEAPFTGEPAVCYRCSVQERHNSRWFSDGGSWHTVAFNEQVSPFYVEDESGCVLVDPEDATLLLNEVTSSGPTGDATHGVTRAEGEANATDDGRETVKENQRESSNDPSAEDETVPVYGYEADTLVEVDVAEEPPERIRDWEQERDSILPVKPRDKVYSEDLLRPGDAVTVAGKAQIFDHGYPERIVIGGDSAPMDVTAGEQYHVTSRLSNAVWTGIVLAVLLLPTGFGLMLWTI